MSNFEIAEQLKRRSPKMKLKGKLHGLSDNEISVQIYTSRDLFLRSVEWRNLRKKAIELYGTTCVKCGAKQKRGRPVNIDHIKPRKYFPHLALDINNLQPLCSPCNKRKGNKVE